MHTRVNIVYTIILLEISLHVHVHVNFWLQVNLSVPFHLFFYEQKYFTFYTNFSLAHLPFISRRSPLNRYSPLTAVQLVLEVNQLVRSHKVHVHDLERQ